MSTDDPRIPYPNLGDQALQALVDRIIAERGDVLSLYRMLLHSPPVAEGWLTFLTSIRQKMQLPGRLRELIILRVAILNSAPYEAQQHLPIAVREGVTSAQIEALPQWASSALFDPIERSVLELTDTVTREVQVPPSMVVRLYEQLGERQTVEVVATIAAYNMVSRVLQALNIH